MPTSALYRRLCQRLLGPEVSTGAMLLLGACIGVVTALDVQEMLKPFVLFIVPAWFLYVAIRLHAFLRRPRSLDFSFTLGIDYNARYRMSDLFVNRKWFEIGVVSTVTSIAMGLIRLVRFGVDTGAESIAFGSVLLGAALLVGALFWLTIRLRLISPARRDPRGFFGFGKTSNAIRSARSRILLACAERASRLLASPRKTILKRQALYLLRYDLFGFLTFNAVSFPIAVLLVWFTRSSDAVIVDLIIAIAPLVIFSVITESLGVSAERIARCTYYEYSPGDLRLVNALIAFAILLPYLLLYIVKSLLLSHHSPLLTVSAAGAFAAAMGSFIVIMSWRWAMPAWNGTSLGLIVLAALAALIGISVPLWGFIFPLAVCLAGLPLTRDLPV